MSTPAILNGNPRTMSSFWQHTGMIELSRLLEVTPRNVTKLVDRLEQDGLVVRNPHPGDRRATLVSATPQGASLLGNMPAEAWPR